MKALNEKMRNLKAASDTMHADAHNTPLERREHLRDLQYNQGQEIFAVQYTNIHKAAIDGSADSIRFFLSGCFPSFSNRLE